MGTRVRAWRQRRRCCKGLGLTARARAECVLPLTAHVRGPPRHKGMSSFARAALCEQTSTLRHRRCAQPPRTWGPPPVAARVTAERLLLAACASRTCKMLATPTRYASPLENLCTGISVVACQGFSPHLRPAGKQGPWRLPPGGQQLASAGGRWPWACRILRCAEPAAPQSQAAFACAAGDSRCRDHIDSARLARQAWRTAGWLAGATPDRSVYYEYKSKRKVFVEATHKLSGANRWQ